MLSDPQIAVLQKILKALEARAEVQLAGLQEETRTVGMAEIRHAMCKFEDGRYGTCERCDLAIPAKELVNEPLLRFCTGCAEAKRTREVRV